MAAAKQNTVNYEDILRDVRARKLKPIYYLMGEESYYIDRISDYIVDTVLKEDEKDFNLTIAYGPETTIEAVINAAKRYPMMGEYQVVLVREAQGLENKDALSYYLKQPQPSTILVICHKHGVLDKRKKLAADIQNVGVLFESKRLYDNQLPAFVATYLKKKGVGIEPEASMILCDSVGSDLNRMTGELDKLILALPEGQMRINAALIEEHIGISKDFNTFELVAAIVAKDVLKANRIVKYFNSNPRTFALQPTLAVLFNFFSNLMLAYYSPQKTEEGIVDWIEQPKWQVTKNILPAMKMYSGIKVMQIISELRQIDAKSKGIGNHSTTDGELLKELIYFILH